MESEFKRFDLSLIYTPVGLGGNGTRTPKPALPQLYSPAFRELLGSGSVPFAG